LPVIWPNHPSLPSPISLVSYSIASFLIYLVFLCSALQLLFAADIPSSLILSTLMMEAIHSYETLVLTRATWCHIPEYGILQ
jgi:hypothetical protein